MKTIVKNSGKIERFDPQKLKKSLDETFRIANSPRGQSEILIKKIIEEFNEWHENKPEITSSDIRRKIGAISKKFHSEAGYIYENFKKIL